MRNLSEINSFIYDSVKEILKKENSNTPEIRQKVELEVIKFMNCNLVDSGEVHLFEVICDERNNSVDVIDSNNLCCKVHWQIEKGSTSHYKTTVYRNDDF